MYATSKIFPDWQYVAFCAFRNAFSSILEVCFLKFKCEERIHYLFSYILKNVGIEIIAINNAETSLKLKIKFVITGQNLRCGLICRSSIKYEDLLHRL